MIEFVRNNERSFGDEIKAIIYRYQCKKCERRFLKKDDREAHQKKTHIHQCTNCNLKFTTQKLLKDHQKKHS